MLEENLRTYLNLILPPLLAQIQEDFRRWSLLPLSLVAWVNSVTMNILPKLSYLIQCIPIFLPQSFFCKLDSLVSEFIWNKKVPRLHRELLQRPRSLGTLALPNFRFCYWAANLRVIQFWMRYKKLPTSPTWLNMEALSSKPATLTALVHSALSLSLSPYSKNVLVKSTLRIWKQYRCHFGLQTLLSFLAPISANPVFHPSLTDRHSLFGLILALRHLVTCILKVSSDPSSSCLISFLYQKHSFSGTYRSAVLFIILVPIFQIFQRPHQLIPS